MENVYCVTKACVIFIFPNFNANLLLPKQENRLNNAKSKMSSYKVEDITDLKIGRTKTGRVVTQFRVKWVGFKRMDWQPMENVFTCPFLLEALQKKKKAQLRARLKPHQRRNEALMRSFGHVRPIPYMLRKTFNHPIETVPKGNEVVKNIAYETRKDGELFWYVRFVGDDSNVYYVRKAVMEYYFPEASAYFHLDRESKKPKISRIVAMNAALKGK